MAAGGPGRLHVGDIDPDFRKHDGRDMRNHCFRCGRGVKGEPACTVRVDDEWLLDQSVPPIAGAFYYPVGSECKKRVPAAFQMDGALVDCPGPRELGGA